MHIFYSEKRAVKDGLPFKNMPRTLAATARPWRKSCARAHGGVDHKIDFTRKKETELLQLSLFLFVCGACPSPFCPQILLRAKAARAAWCLAFSSCSCLSSSSSLSSPARGPGLELRIHGTHGPPSSPCSVHALVQVLENVKAGGPVVRVWVHARGARLQTLVTWEKSALMSLKSLQILLEWKSRVS